MMICISTHIYVHDVLLLESLPTTLGEKSIPDQNIGALVRKAHLSFA